MCKIELGNLAAACCREAIHASAVRWDALPTDLWELELLVMDEMYILLLEEYIEGAQDLVEYSTTAVGDLLRHWMPSQQIDSASPVIDRNPVTPDEIAGVTKVKIYDDWVEFTPALL